jgi:hypothetical protein
MKPTILLLLLLATVPDGLAQDAGYRANLQSLHDRFAALEMVRHDYLKPQPRLSPEQEQERLRLHGQLVRDDPVWVLYEQLDADIKALEAARTKTDSDTGLINTLKNLLATVTGVLDQPTTRAQADEYATALRQFVARRDEAGATAWSKSH